MKITIIHKILFVLGVIFNIFVWLFPGHVYVNFNGVLIMKNNLYMTLDPANNVSEISNYDCIINLQPMKLELPGFFFGGTPLKVMSEKKVNLI